MKYVPAKIYNCIISPDSKNFFEKTSIYHSGTSEKPWLEMKDEKYYEIWWKYARHINYDSN